MDTALDRTVWTQQIWGVPGSNAVSMRTVLRLIYPCTKVKHCNRKNTGHAVCILQKKSDEFFFGTMRQTRLDYLELYTWTDHRQCCVPVSRSVFFFWRNADVDRFPIDDSVIIFSSIYFFSNAVSIYIILLDRTFDKRLHTSFYINRALRVGQLDKIDIALTWKKIDALLYISLK